MAPLSAAQLARETGGRLTGPDPESVGTDGRHDVGAAADLGTIVVSGDAAIDSRKVRPGGLFVAIEGEHVDGHDFARAAYEQGAALVLGSRPTGVPTLVVDDATLALGQIARLSLESVVGPTVAITGSQGKTGVKDLTAQILAANGRTVATQANLNNELGVPLTALRCDRDTEFLVLEMGARGVGHIRYLCSIAPPAVAAVLNIGTAHLGEFGTREAIAEAKGEIIEALGPGGVGVVHAGEPYAEQLLARRRFPDRTSALTFGEHGEVNFRDVEFDDLGRATATFGFRDDSARVALRQVGAHQVLNAAAALAIALAAQVPFARAIEPLAAARSLSRWRMEVNDLAGGGVLINDAYNANPASMEAAIGTIADIGRRRGVRSIAILGPMAELGETSRAEHVRVGKAAAAAGVDLLLGVGADAAELVDGFVSARGAPEAGVLVEDRGAALAWLRLNRRPDDVLVVKASRVAELERLAAAIVEEDG